MGRTVPGRHPRGRVLRPGQEPGAHDRGHSRPGVLLFLPILLLSPWTRCGSSVSVCTVQFQKPWPVKLCSAYNCWRSCWALSRHRFMAFAKATGVRTMLDIPAVRSDQTANCSANFDIDNVNCLPSAGGAANPAAGVPTGHRAGHRLLVAVPARQVRISRDTFISIPTCNMFLPPSFRSILTWQCSQSLKRSFRNGTFLSSAPLTEMHCHLPPEQPSLLSSIPHHPRAAVCAVATRITLGGRWCASMATCWACTMTMCSAHAATPSKGAAAHAAAP